MGLFSRKPKDDTPKYGTLHPVQGVGACNHRFQRAYIRIDGVDYYALKCVVCNQIYSADKGEWDSALTHASI